MEKLLNKLPQNWEDRIMPLMTLNNNFVLGGSLALHILKIMDYDFNKRTPDLDFSLTEPFEEKKFLTLLDFFNLSIVRGINDYGDDGHPLPQPNQLKSLEKELIMLEYNGSVINFIEEGSYEEYKEKYYRIDFFNKNYLKKKDWFELDYFGTPIKLTHPSIILAAKMMYASDNRVGKQYKHFKDIQSIDWDNYFKIVKRIRSKHKEVKNEGEGYQPFKYVLDKYVYEDYEGSNVTLSSNNELSF